MVRKQNEYQILSAVYNLNDYAEVLASECPDFRLLHKGSDVTFGVEVTEFYFSHSNARLRNMPDYFNEIYNHNRYRHKEDRVRLQLSDITILSPDGKVKEITKGIFQELPNPDKYVEMISDLIKSKNEKYIEYAQDLTHINLILLDTENRLRPISVSDFYNYFYTSEVKTSLCNSPFREIFLITMLQENRKVYIPLKMILFLANFWSFGQLLEDYPWETGETSSPILAKQKDSTAKLMMLFAIYLKSKAEKVYTRNDEGRIEVVFGNCGLINDEGHIIVHDYNDYPIPNDIESIDDSDFTSLFCSAEFKQKEKEILDDYTFSTEIAFDLKSDLEF